MTSVAVRDPQCCNMSSRSVLDASSPFLHQIALTSCGFQSQTMFSMIFFFFSGHQLWSYYIHLFYPRCNFKHSNWLRHKLSSTDYLIPTCHSTAYFTLKFGDKHCQVLIWSLSTNWWWFLVPCWMCMHGCGRAIRRCTMPCRTVTSRWSNCCWTLACATPRGRIRPAARW